MSKYSDERKEQHYEVMYDLLKYINNQTPDFILKGGTSLLMCYGLQRFSEDIDFNSTNKGIGKYIDTFCKERNCSYVIAKDTPTVKRYKIHYNNDERYLKVEISYRNRNIDESKVCVIDGIRVYKINEIAIQKTNAYVHRDKLRDLYDVCFICNNYWDELSDDTKAMMSNAIEYKGIEQFDYITKDQSDELIDNETLLDDFLNTCDRLGLVNDNDTQNKEEEIEL